MSLSRPEPPKRQPAANGPTTLEGVKIRGTGEPTVKPVKSPKASRRSSNVLTGDKGNKPLRVRIVIVGSEGGGKSCIIKRYCEKRFVAKYLPTVGIDYGATRIFVDKKEVSVHIFDTSGTDLFKEVRNEFYREAHGLLLVLDVTRRETFDSLPDLLNEIKLELSRDCRDTEHTVCFLAANKCDVSSDRREVDDMEARLWAELHGFNFFETSASSGQGITDMFQAFFSQIVRLVESGVGTKTPRPGKKQVGTVTKIRDRMTASPPTSPAQPQPSAEQAGVMKRIRGGRDSWDQLGVDRGASKEDVNKTYRKLAVLLHPDKTEVAGAQEAFKILGQARANILKSFRD